MAENPFTRAVMDGEVTEFSDFAWWCLRAFDVASPIHEEPVQVQVPERYEPDAAYYDERIAAAEALLSEMGALSAEEREGRAQQEYAARLAEWETAKAKADVEMERLTAMLAKAEAWEPPSPRVGRLKLFMIESLRETIRFHGPGSKPERLSGVQWRRGLVSEAKTNIAHWRRQRDEEIARTEGRNSYLAELRASLLGGEVELP